MYFDSGPLILNQHYSCLIVLVTISLKRIKHVLLYHFSIKTCLNLAYLINQINVVRNNFDDMLLIFLLSYKHLSRWIRTSAHREIQLLFDT